MTGGRADRVSGRPPSEVRPNERPFGVATLIHSLALAAAIMLTGCAHGRQSECPASPQAKGEIERTVHAFFDALRKEDKVAFQRLTTPSFDSFDVGKRYPATDLVEVVKDAHARGVQLNWSVGRLDTKLRCDVAWAAWENVGSVGIPPDVRPVRWLESAVLVHQSGSWKIDFYHSQRATEKEAPQT